jgi:hypothetical protein
MAWQHQQQQVSEVLGKLKFMESQGVDPVVVAGSGKFGASIPGVVVAGSGKFGASIPGRLKPPAGTVDWSKVGACIEDLEQMYRSEENRKIILEAWERFQDEVY